MIATPPDNDEHTTHSDTDTEDTSLVDSNDISFEGESSEQSDAPLTRKGLIQALKRGVANGILTKQQAAQIRLENNITQSEFTKKKRDPKKVKRKRKIQKNARKVTRQQGFRGVKNDKGKGVSVNY